jgi:hypothetical protein
MFLQKTCKKIRNNKIKINRNNLILHILVKLILDIPMIKIVYKKLKLIVNLDICKMIGIMEKFVNNVVFKWPLIMIVVDFVSLVVQKVIVRVSKKIVYKKITIA